MNVRVPLRALGAAALGLLVAFPVAPDMPNVLDLDGPSLSIDEAEVAIEPSFSADVPRAEPVDGATSDTTLPASGIPDELAFSEPSAPATTTLSLSTTDGVGPVGDGTEVGDTRQAASVRAELVEAGRQLFSSAVGLRGRVVGAAGPIGGAVVRVGATLQTTNDDGLFWFDLVPRRNDIVRINANGYYERTIAQQLAVSSRTELIDMGTITLTAEQDGRVRLLFAGDVALGRRYLDPFGTEANDRVPPDNAQALIQPSQAYNDTADLLDALESTFAPFDLVSVSLESVVSDRPTTPRSDLSTHVFSLPESVAALSAVGVDHVALANNRAVDFGGAGIAGTIEHLDDTSIGHSGAGADLAGAYVPYAIDLRGTTVGINSYAAVEGQVGLNPLGVDHERAGIADLNNDALVDWSLRAADVLDVSVAHAHTGYEYTESPDTPDPSLSHARERMEFLAARGADLVVGHHPSVAQGFGYDGDALLAYSLGNLVIDHSRIDASTGLALETTWDDGSLTEARAVPVVLDDFKPSRLIGEPADLTLRRISHASDPGVVLVPDHDGAIVSRRDQVRTVERSVTLTLEPDAFGVAVIDLRSIRQPHESLAAITTASAEPAVQVGRDLMVFGAMEDTDTDAESLDVPHWELTGNASFACVDNTNLGDTRTTDTTSLCSIRSSSNTSASSILFDTPVVVLGDRLNDPNKNLTFLVRHAGANRGDLYVDATYRASVGTEEFGRAQILALPSGDHDYRTSWVDLALPADDPAITPSPDRPYGTRLRRENPRAMEFRIRHLPPSAGTGVAFVDDVAVISWSSPAPELVTPNPFDFIRLEGVAPGETADITLVRYYLA